MHASHHPAETFRAADWTGRRLLPLFRSRDHRKTAARGRPIRTREVRL